VTPRSFAAQNLPLISSRLESAYGVIAGMLGTDLHGAMVDVYLSELVVEYGGQRLGGGGYAIPRRMQIHDIYIVDSPGESLERSLLILLLALAQGDDREPAPLIVDGLHADIMQRLNPLPAGDQTLAQLVDAKNRNELPSVSSLLFGPAKGIQVLYYPVAVNFVGYLLQNYGIERFKRFVHELDPNRPDAAAQAVFGLSMAQLDKAWNKTIKLGRPGGILRFLKLSLFYMRGYKLKVAEIIIYICLGVAFVIGLAKVQQYLFDHALPHPANPGRPSLGTVPGDSRALAAIMIGLIIAFVIVSLAQLRQSYVTAFVSESVLKEMRLKMFSLIQRLHPGFFQTTRTGDIMSRMTSDMAAIQNALTGSMAQGFRMILTLVAAVVTIFITDWKLAAIGILGTPLFFVTTRYLGPAAARASKNRQRQLAGATSDLQENLGAQPVVKAFGLEDRMVRDYSGALDKVFRSSIRLTYLTGLYSLSANSVATGINLAVLGVGAALVIGGHLTQGVLVAFLGLMAQVIGPVQNLSGILQGLQQASGAMDRVDEMLRVEPAIKDSPSAVPIAPLSQAIRLENITFGYIEGQTQLHDLNLVIPAGASVALVGPSGCGKSTILNMIMRFYDPDAGRVTFDGVDIREATIASVRGQMGVVFQDNVLFNISIRENIRLGNLDATDEDVEAACQAAEIHELVMSLPDEYDTVVGERGSRLSGGQRQRMAIARAILRNPTILILDEATSALDPRTEAAINETLVRIGRGRTTVSVTHRLSSVVNADRIYVLDRGALVEEGTHDELLEHGDLYAQLWQEQGGAVAGGAKQAGVEVSRLQNIPMFAQLDPTLLTALAKRLMIERFPAGEEIIHQGDPGDKLYIVQRGQVEVVASDLFGQARPLAALREGDYFGEMALLNDMPRAATVRARSPVQVYSLSKGDFTGLLNATPQLRDMMEHVMAERMVALAPRPAGARTATQASPPRVR
jgi:ABC-type multidrug transport system fused ATPase/permease subunit